MKRLLSQEQIKALQADMSELLQRHGLTAGYLVGEYRDGETTSAKLSVVAVSAVRPVMPTQFLTAMAEQTYAIVRSVSRMEGPIINDN